MSLWSDLIDLATTLGPLSFATIGGGQSALADIQRQVVEVHGWLSQEQFLNDFAISRMAPGPGIIYVTLIGWSVAGPWGAVVATAALFLPTAILILGAAMLWSRFSEARFLRALEAGLRPVAAGLVLAGVYVLARTMGGGWAAGAMALLSTVLLLRTRINPLLLIGGAALLFGGLSLAGVTV